MGGFQASSLSNWLDWPSRFWSLGPAALTQTVLDGGLRSGQTDQARAIYDETVASYRQTVLTGFQNVEDNLAALSILEQEAQVQDEAVVAARKSVALTTDQYKVGIVSYLNVVTAQTFALTDERTAVSIASRRMTASVLLVKALGGGWNVSSLAVERRANRQERLFRSARTGVGRTIARGERPSALNKRGGFFSMPRHF